MSLHQVPDRDFPEINLLPNDRKLSRSLSLDTVPQSRRSSTRRSSRGRRRSRAKWLSPEQKARERKRKITVYVVVGTFLFILFSCILVVIVTLTHQTETTSKRNIRKENEELMNSLDDPTNLHNLTGSVPVALK